MMISGTLHGHNVNLTWKAPENMGAWLDNKQVSLQCLLYNPQVCLRKKINTKTYFFGAVVQTILESRENSVIPVIVSSPRECNRDSSINLCKFMATFLYCRINY